MAIETIDECNGCAECIGCGRRGRTYQIMLCDNCCNEIGSRAYPVDGKYLCGECRLETLDSVSTESLLD